MKQTVKTAPLSTALNMMVEIKITVRGICNDI
jgi:hypothetical protein